MKVVTFPPTFFFDREIVDIKTKGKTGRQKTKRQREDSLDSVPLCEIIRLNEKRTFCGGYVLVSISSSITSGFRDNADGIGLFRPLFCTEAETVQSCLRFNYVEFGTIKIRVHQPLPYSKKLNGIAIAQLRKALN